ncbi:hypothetical protein [Flavobacterium sp. PS2]|uniref:hypothetical protein n=1 Tax=Flavobacterium sp. PS2 TaxID=3384157 RepID=UPI00390C74E6
MELKTFIIVLSLFCFSAISQSVQKDSCQLFFKEIGIRDFILGSNYTQFVKESKSIKRKFKKEDAYGIDVVTFNEKTIILQEKKTVAYNLKFKDDILISYDFTVDAGDYRESMAYYERILLLLSKNKNNFIKIGRINNMETNKTCKKLFWLVPNDSIRTRECLNGGISYTDPKLWEQQAIEYLKTIKKKKN